MKHVTKPTGKAVLEDLRFQGYSPRPLLDVGAHIGSFTYNFLQVFPDCRPTMVEPNPHCDEALAKLPFERHMVAASNEAGTAAPHVDYSSKGDVRRMFGGFQSVDIDVRNFDNTRFIPRERLLGNVDRLLGLDLYITARK